MFNFLRDVKAEMAHMNWPSRKQTIAYTLMVVVISIFVAIYVGAFDHLFSLIVKQFTN